MIALPGIAILAHIYESANSLIYRGRREKDNLPIILKLLKHDNPNPIELIRYKQEYQLTRYLNIEGVIKTYELQKYKNTLAIIFEDFEGESLKYWLKTNKFSLTEFLKFAVRIVEILDKIHQSNVIHKDINPSNLVWNPQTEQLKIIDFGISTRLLQENITLKNLNSLEGTLAYISPEQTGRMNRAIDYRTDFYSLGVTFYELLTNRLPFESNDPLELVHSHLAKYPLAPHEIDSKIPLAVSQIVMKLLAKTAEERYQSAYGIKIDLENCFDQLEKNKTIAIFELGTQDSCDRFQIPQKLYGRESQIQTLLNTFERVSSGRSEIMLVSGYSGIGKSCLVREIYKPITNTSAYFTSGKFDQLQRHIPYYALVKALQQLIEQLLLESETALQTWRDKILAVLGSNGRIIIEIVPEVELIIGKQPNVPELPAKELQNRFNLVFQKFVRILASKEHPLVLFLDDLQWVDSATLELLKQIFTDVTTQGLFLIGAYRDNEVSEVHPLKIAIAEIQKQGTIVNEIALEPLDVSTISQLIADTLKCDLESVEPLAALVVRKTQGNPFFVKEFLKSLYTEDLLTFNFKTQQWEWDLDKIQNQSITDNVVDLMVGKIQKLPQKTQQILNLAACLGDRFDLKTLAIANQKSLKSTLYRLWMAIQCDLIIPISEPNNKELNIVYKFAHDRIQQAAYSLIPESLKPAIHLQIGRSLLNSIALQQQEEKIFELVKHMNLGIELLEGQQRYELAQLNLIAARKAKASTAYQFALTYLQQGLNLLAIDIWERQYDTALTFYTEAVEVAYLCANLDEMDRLAAIVRERAKTIVDQIKVDAIAISACIAQNKMLEGIAIALKILKSLDVELPENPTHEDIPIAYRQTQNLLQEKKPSELARLIAMTDANSLAAIAILTRMTAAAYMAVPALYPLIVFKMVGLLATYGNVALSSYIYASYGLLLCGVMNDIETGYQFGRVALNLLLQQEYGQSKAKTLFIANHFIVHWKDSITATLQPLQSGYLNALEGGDWEYTGYCGFTYCLHSYLVGKELGELEATMASYSHIFNNLKQQSVSNYLQIYRQTVQNLLGQTEDPCCLVGTAYDENVMLPQQQQAGNQTALFYIFVNKLVLGYLFYDFDRAVEYANIAKQYLAGVTANVTVPIFYFWDSLAHLANWNEGNKKNIEERVSQNQEKMQQWAIHAPTNLSHKYYLVEAERHRVLGEIIEAMEDYDRALELARDNEYINEEAIACELAARFYLGIERIRIAKTYIEDARYCYLCWGATAKVEHIEKSYSQLLGRIFSKTGAIANQSTVKSTTDSPKLDLMTAIKVAQTLSEEIVLEKLLKKLMQTIVENAGAQRGYLILERQGQLLIEASGSVDSEDISVLKSIPLDNRVIMLGLPTTIINYVARTRENVVLDDARKEEKFNRDRYLINSAKTQPVISVLCTPLIHQGKFLGVVYLENNLAMGAFSSERVDILQLICSQAAISLENAQLYAEKEEYTQTLEQKVADRTAQLENVNQELKRLANLDGLTQIANRRRFDEYLALEWKRSLRERQPLSLILYDVDYFKLYNDYYGHQAGDECLKQIAKASSNAVKRSIDLLARYGGEEFAVILSNTNTEGAIVVAREICERIRQLKIPHQQSKVKNYVTLSLGIATIIPTLDSSSETLIATADTALYEAKRQGRDRFKIMNYEL
jgi:diguanylate cyclase (GGDEF)-like protein